MQPSFNLLLRPRNNHPQFANTFIRCLQGSIGAWKSDICMNIIDFLVYFEKDMTETCLGSCRLIVLAVRKRDGPDLCHHDVK